MSPSVRSASIVALALALVACGGCIQRFSPTALPAETIPKELRAEANVKRLDDVVWHVCEVWADGHFLAYTGISTAPDGPQYLAYHVAWTSGGLGTGGEEYLTEAKAYHGMYHYGVESHAEGGRVYHVDAYGIAFDRRAVEVVGVTTEGQTVRTTPVNGFWALAVGDPLPDEKWASVTARSASGRVLFSYHRLWQGGAPRTPKPTAP